MIRTTLYALSALALVAACDPRVFSDLEDETWVRSSGRPDGMDSDDYVFALAFAARADTAGSRIIVTGNSPATVGSVEYTDSGSADSSGIRVSELRLLEDSTTLAERRPLAGSDELINGAGWFAIGMPVEDDDAGTGIIILADALTRTTQRVIGGRPGIMEMGSTVAFATTDHDSAMGTGIDLLATAVNTILLFPDMPAQDAIEPVQCTVNREVAYRAIGADVDAATAGDEVLIMRGDLTLDATAAASDVVVTTGALIAEAHAAADGGRCWDDTVAVPRAETAILTSPSGERDFGLELDAGDFNGNGTVDVVAAAPSAGVVYVFLDLDVTAPAAPIEVRPAGGATGFGKALATGDLDGDGNDELVVGAPDATIDGTSAAGTAFVFGLATGETSFALINQLHDAEPEGNQQFGRDVLVAPFGTGGLHILAVATNGELFTYFQAAAEFPDVRQ